MRNNLQFFCEKLYGGLLNSYKNCCSEILDNTIFCTYYLDIWKLQCCIDVYNILTLDTCSFVTELLHCQAASAAATKATAKAISTSFRRKIKNKKLAQLFQEGHYLE